MDNLPDVAYKAFWTGVAAVLGYLSTVTIDVGPQWTLLTTTVFTAVLVEIRKWVDKRTGSVI